MASSSNVGQVFPECDITKEIADLVRFQALDLQFLHGDVPDVEQFPLQFLERAVVDHLTARVWNSGRHENTAQNQARPAFAGGVAIFALTYAKSLAATEVDPDLKMKVQVALTDLKSPERKRQDITRLNLWSMQMQHTLPFFSGVVDGFVLAGESPKRLRAHSTLYTRLQQTRLGAAAMAHYLSANEVKSPDEKSNPR